MHADTETKHAIRVREDFTGNSLCVVYFYSFSSSFLCDSWLGNGSSCFLEVVALSAGEKGGAYGSQDSHQMVSAQREKETQTRETNGTEQYLL